MASRRREQHPDGKLALDRQCRSPRCQPLLNDRDDIGERDEGRLRCGEVVFDGEPRLEGSERGVGRDLLKKTTGSIAGWPASA